MDRNNIKVRGTLFIQLLYTRYQWKLKRGHTDCPSLTIDMKSSVRYCKLRKVGKFELWGGAAVAIAIAIAVITYDGIE